MSRSHVVTALVALAAGLTASAARRHLATRRRPAAAAAVAASPTAPGAPAPAVPAAGDTAPGQDAVVLPFARRAESAPAAPVRCGDNGGVTKAGAPCGARAAAGGRCHHHRMAA